MKKPLKLHQNKKILSQNTHKKIKNKKNPKIYVFGRIGRIPYDPTILYNLTQSYVRSYHFYDPKCFDEVGS